MPKAKETLCGKDVTIAGNNNGTMAGRDKGCALIKKCPGISEILSKEHPTKDLMRSTRERGLNLNEGQERDDLGSRQGRHPWRQRSFAGLKDAEPQALALLYLILEVGICIDPIVIG